jgi:hypothetical protein
MARGTDKVNDKKYKPENEKEKAHLHDVDVDGCIF